MNRLRTQLFLFCTTVLPTAAVAQGISGTWTYREKLEGVMSTADFVLLQQGTRVFGTWEESQGRRWAGCLTGQLKGNSVVISLCHSSETTQSTTAQTCPAYSNPEDKLVLSGDRLAWHRLNTSSGKWEPYLTLTRGIAPKRLSVPLECGKLAP